MTGLQRMEERSGFLAGGLEHRSRYNITPAQPVLAVFNGTNRRVEYLGSVATPSTVQKGNSDRVSLSHRIVSGARKSDSPLGPSRGP